MDGNGAPPGTEAPGLALARVSAFHDMLDFAMLGRKHVSTSAE
jgi:hypothetical protein